MQGNQNLLCGPVMMLNCCCNSHSTTRHVNCKKGCILLRHEHKHVVSIVVVVVMRRRWVQRSEARGRGVGRWRHRYSKSMQIRRPHENGRAAFSFFIFFTLRPIFKKVRFQVLQYMCVFAKEHFRMDGPLDLASAFR